MINQEKNKLQVLTNAEQRQLDGGVYLFGPDMHIAPRFPYGPVGPIDGFIVENLPEMITHGANLL